MLRWIQSSYFRSVVRVLSCARWCHAEVARITLGGDNMKLGYQGCYWKSLYSGQWLYGTWSYPSRVSMFMHGDFVTVKGLASKFYGLYSLSCGLLSKQKHYHWELLPIKFLSVVTTEALTYQGSAHLCFALNVDICTDLPTIPTLYLADRHLRVHMQNTTIAILLEGSSINKGRVVSKRNHGSALAHTGLLETNRR